MLQKAIGVTNIKITIRNPTPQRFRKDARVEVKKTSLPQMCIEERKDKVAKGIVGENIAIAVGLLAISGDRATSRREWEEHRWK